MINTNWIDETIKKTDEKLSRTSMLYRDFIPYSVENGKFTTRYNDNPNWWTNGFWGGLMWLMYKNTGKQCYIEAARKSEEMLDRAFENYEGIDHDAGFMWDYTAGESYRQTGDEASKKRFLYAADILAGRYNVDGGFITAWNGKETKGWAIIDCMMNLPLLYKASEIVGHDRFKKIAIAHADKTMLHHVRPDGSVNHIVVYDTETGELLETIGGQGYGVGSSWSRGQAWAIYGFALSYAHTGKNEYLDTAKRVAHYFIAATCDEYISRTDFRAPEEPQLYDTSAGMIAAAGMLEIAKYVTEYEKKLYVNNAYKILKATVDKYADWSESYDGLLKNGMESYKKGVAEHLIYGDYYLVDALYKLQEFLKA